MSQDRATAPTGRPAADNRSEARRLVEDERAACRCFDHPPCELCMAMTVEEADAYADNGRAGLQAFWARQDDAEEARQDPWRARFILRGASRVGDHGPGTYRRDLETIDGVRVAYLEWWPFDLPMPLGGTFRAGWLVVADSSSDGARDGIDLKRCRVGGIPSLRQALRFALAQVDRNDRDIAADLAQGEVPRG